MESVMQKNNQYVVIHTADDEEPNCMRCDFYDKCIPDKCGAEHGWHNYKSTEIIT